MKVSPYFILALGVVWAGLAIDKTIIHPRDLPSDYLSVVIAAGFLAQFAWMKWKAPKA